MSLDERDIMLKVLRYILLSCQLLVLFGENLFTYLLKHFKLMDVNCLISTSVVNKTLRHSFTWHDP